MQTRATPPLVVKNFREWPGLLAFLMDLTKSGTKLSNPGVLVMNTRFFVFAAVTVLLTTMPGATVFAQNRPVIAPEVAQPPEVTLHNLRFREAQEIDTTLNTQVGQLAIRPAELSVTIRSKPEISCNYSCSAYEPGKGSLYLTWAETLSQPTTSSADTAAVQRKLRLDISGTASGFQEGRYGTIKLSQIPEIPAVRTPANTPPGTAAINDRPAPVLLRFVEAGRIVQRSPNLPVFQSPNDLNLSMTGTTMPDAVRQTIQDDLITGGLGQVQLLSKSIQSLHQKNYQNVSMEGLQPALSYRFRLVEEKDSSAKTIAQQICHIPVCPVDYVDIP